MRVFTGKKNKTVEMTVAQLQFQVAFVQTAFQKTPSRRMEAKIGSEQSANDWLDHVVKCLAGKTPYLQTSRPSVTTVEWRWVNLANVKQRVCICV